MIRRLASSLAAALPEAAFSRLYQWRDTTRLGHLVMSPFAKLLRTEDARIARGVGAGLLINSSGDNASYALGIAEPQVQALLKDRVASGGTYYDIGANIGFFTLLGARLVGPTGHVVAFEPVAATADVLEANVALNEFQHVRVVRSATSDTDGTVEMTVGDLSQVAHFTGVGAAGASREGRVEVVSTVTVDGLVASGTIPPPTFVKMDIEGAEMLALRGMRDVLATHRPTVLCEVHGTAPEVHDFLAALSYTCTVVEDGDLRDPALHAHILALP